MKRLAGARAALALAGLLAACSAHPAPAGKTPALFRAEQAEAGEQAYLASCSACHGVRLDGGAGPPLRGERMRARAQAAHLRVGDMFSTIAQQMPLNQPASLTEQQYVDIMAYVLESNGYPAGTAALTHDDALRSEVPFRPVAAE